MFSAQNLLITGENLKTQKQFFGFYHNPYRDIVTRVIRVLSVALSLKLRTSNWIKIFLIHHPNVIGSIFKLFSSDYKTCLVFPSWTDCALHTHTLPIMGSLFLRLYSTNHGLTISEALLYQSWAHYFLSSAVPIMGSLFLKLYSTVPIMGSLFRKLYCTNHGLTIS